jgi:hypothetical protein
VNANLQKVTNKTFVFTLAFVAIVISTAVYPFIKSCTHCQEPDSQNIVNSHLPTALDVPQSFGFDNSSIRVSFEKTSKSRYVLRFKHDIQEGEVLVKVPVDRVYYVFSIENNGSTTYELLAPEEAESEMLIIPIEGLDLEVNVASKLSAMNDLDGQIRLEIYRRLGKELSLDISNYKFDFFLKP